MITRDQVVAAARAWCGVPWRHQGRSRVGVDCVGLLMVVARELALLPADRLDAIESQAAGYSRYPTGDALRAALAAHLAAATAPQPGDVLLFRIGREPQHLALAGDRGAQLSIIHAYAATPRRVVETLYDAPWRQRCVAVYRLPGVA